MPDHDDDDDYRPPASAEATSETHDPLNEQPEAGAEGAHSGSDSDSHGPLDRDPNPESDANASEDAESQPPLGRYSQLVLTVLKRIKADPTPPTEGKGRWPSTREQFLWDLAPDQVAQDGDGVIAPSWGPPAWVDGVTDPKEVARMLEVSRTYRKDSEETIRNLELKAARLATVLVALLTANVALIVFEITRLGPDPGPLRAGLVLLGVALGLVSAAYLLVGLTRAVDADQRMGITSRSGLGDVAKEPRKAMEHEAIGYAVSNWTRKNKASRLIYARAAVSRSMVFLVISALIAIALAVLGTLQKDAAGASERQTPAQRQSTDRAIEKTPSVQPTPTSAARPTPQPTIRATPWPTPSSTALKSTPVG